VPPVEPYPRRSQPPVLLPGRNPPPAPPRRQEWRPVRIALLLPMHSDALGAAAEAVRAGFMAASNATATASPSNLIETGDSPRMRSTPMPRAAQQRHHRRPAGAPAVTRWPPAGW
jgi:hypothetical protein